MGSFFAVSNAFQEVDTSKDGQVDWQEFLTLMRWRPPTVSLATDEEVFIHFIFSCRLAVHFCEERVLRLAFRFVLPTCLEPAS